MTRVTFGVSASSFAANMAVKQNALDHTDSFPAASEEIILCGRLLDWCFGSCIRLTDSTAADQAILTRRIRTQEMEFQRSISSEGDP